MRRERRQLIGEVLGDDAAGGGVDAGIGNVRAPGLELRVEVVEIAEGPGEEEVLADITVRRKSVTTL